MSSRRLLPAKVVSVEPRAEVGVLQMRGSLLRAHLVAAIVNHLIFGHY